jgi:predicted RecB family endonuclease
VRGTVFEINLDRNYIHSVDHSVHLTNVLGQAVTLLPGELVEATDILKKLTQATLDRAWGEYNKVRDRAESLIQAVNIEKSIALLDGKFGA